MWAYGSRGQEVLRAQILLQAAGFDAGALDGVWGPRSEAAWLASLKAPEAPPRVGLWVDKQPERGKEETWLNDLAALGLPDYSLCAFGPEGSLYAPPTPGTRSRRARDLRARLPQGAKVGACLWADARIDRSAPAQSQWLRVMGDAIDYVDLDAEEQARGFTLTSARSLIDALKSNTDAPIGVNAVPHYGPDPEGSPLLGELALVEAVMEAQGTCELFLQVYTAWTDKTWTHDGLFRPGVFQRWAARVALVWRRRFGSGLRVGFGFALYGQAHPKPHPQGVEALQVSLDEALRLAPAWSPDHPPALRGWSSKHITTKSRTWLKEQAQ